jgi:two-component system, OmpR family, response regulator
MPKVFLVEDDLALSSIMSDRLTKYNYLVHKVTDFKNVEQQFEESKSDIVLMDINLPYLDGYYFVRFIRRISNVPIIIISARNSSSEQIMGIEFGADDYVIKPFDLEVLLAKMGALLRRMDISKNDFNSIIKVGSLELDTERLLLKSASNIATLSKNEYKLIKMLMEKPGSIISREVLFEELWDDVAFVEENTLSVNVTRLKTRLEELGFPNAIKVKRGAGYYLDKDKLQII